MHNLKQQLVLLEKDKSKLELECQDAEENGRNVKHSGRRQDVYLILHLLRPRTKHWI